MTRQPWGRQKYYSIFDIVRGRKVKPFSIFNPTVSEENLSLLTFSGEVRLPGGGEAGAGEDEEEESVHPRGCGGHGHYHAACTNQLSTKLNHCMRLVMLSIALPFLSLSIVHVRYTFLCLSNNPLPLSFSCLFPPSSNVMLTMSPSPNPHPHVQSLAELVAWTRQQSAWSAVLVLVLATRRQLKMFYQNNNNFRPLLRPPSSANDGQHTCAWPGMAEASGKSNG